MLSPFDVLSMRKDAWDNRLSYREVLLVFPTVTTGSNYEPFTDSPYEVTGALSGQYTVTYTTYRAKARTKIIQDTTLALFSQSVPGLEVGDYLLYFADRDKAMVDKTLPPDPNSYIVIDGLTMKPSNSTLNGVGKTFDVFIHAKRFSPKYRLKGT